MRRLLFQVNPAVVYDAYQTAVRRPPLPRFHTQYSHALAGWCWCFISLAPVSFVYVNDHRENYGRLATSIRASANTSTPTYRSCHVWLQVLGNLSRGRSEVRLSIWHCLWVHLSSLSIRRSTADMFYARTVEQESGQYKSSLILLLTASSNLASRNDEKN